MSAFKYETGDMIVDVWGCVGEVLRFENGPPHPAYYVQVVGNIHNRPYQPKKILWPLQNIKGRFTDPQLYEAILCWDNGNWNTAFFTAVCPDNVSAHIETEEAFSPVVHHIVRPCFDDLPDDYVVTQAYGQQKQITIGEFKS